MTEQRSWLTDGDPVDLVLPSAPEAENGVREWVAGLLNGHGPPTIDKVSATAAHLVASAIEHGSGEKIDVRLVYRHGTIWCQVSNDSRSAARQVKAITFPREDAKRWGSFELRGRVSVWFEVPIPRGGP